MRQNRKKWTGINHIRTESNKDLVGSFELGQKAMTQHTLINQ